MNKIILMGRLSRDCEISYSQGAEPMAINRFAIAVDRQNAKKLSEEGKQNCDFINCVAFGKRGEVISQYFHKGNRIALTGRLQISSYTDKDNNKRYSTDVLVEEFEFCENKNNSGASASQQPEPTGFVQVDDNEADLPF